MRRQMLAALLSSGVTGGVQAQVFETLDVLPGCNGSWAAGVSADGQVVVGSCSAGVSPDPVKGFRWTAAGGMVDLGVLSPGEPLGATGVSADGMMICGTGGVGNGSRAFRWVLGAGLTDLGIAPGYCGGGLRAWAISADGRTVVGACPSFAFRWFSVDGMHIMDYPGWGPALHHAVSQDGSVVCGQGIHAVVSGYWRAYRWTAGTGPVTLGSLPGLESSDAAAMSADGAVIVGSSFNGSSGVTRPMRWTAATGMMELPMLPGWTWAKARAVSADGAIVAGDFIAGAVHGAWISAPNLGTRDLGELLATLGVNLSAWQQIEIYAMSADGRTLVGDVFELTGARHGVIIRLPGALTCYANCDVSTAPPVVNILDFVCFLNRFSSGDSYANCDNSSAPPVLNVSDFVCFLNRFAAGCS